MKSSRRGFFAMLAALPAVAMGRKAIAGEGVGVTGYAYLGVSPNAFVPNRALPPPSYQFIEADRAEWVRTEFGWRCEKPGVIGDGDLVLDVTAPPFAPERS